ncbi:MAG: ABC-type molybdate transport system, periplasmic component [Myxococcaceae bacterium]|nr:ABC-type molybdate transport system, periplasmic component [Myxococcaceae bacterium]
MRPLFSLLLLGLALGGCRDRKEVVIFHATSLSRAFGELKERYERQHPGVRVRLEPSGSQLAARKVSELGLRADLVVVADAAINDQLLVPAWAPWNLRFTSNALVLAHLEHSRFTEEVTAENWAEVVLRPQVRLARVDPDLAPLGYHTLLAWQLAERALGKPALARALQARADRIVFDEAELLGLLEARAVDYAFLYRSTAEDHRLKVTRLPDAYNLSAAALAGAYAEAEVEVRMKLATERQRLKGAPIVYGLAVPANAPNPDGALGFVELLLSEEGRRTLQRLGFAPIELPTCTGPCTLPARLEAAVGGRR